MIDERKEFLFVHVDGTKRTKHTLFYDEVTEKQFAEVSRIVEAARIVDDEQSSSLADVLGTQLKFSTKDVYPQVLAVVLFDENGNTREADFYRQCRHMDVEKAGAHFFESGGYFLMNGMGNLLISKMLKALQVNALKA